MDDGERVEANGAESSIRDDVEIETTSPGCYVFDAATGRFHVTRDERLSDEHAPG